MKLVAVVVTHNRLDQLQKTISRLLDEPIDRIVVIDSLSSDGTRRWLTLQTDPRLDVHLLDINGGGALGFETGMRRAMSHGPDWLMLMDDDARPEPGAVDTFRMMDKTGAEAVAAAARLPTGEICDMNRPWINPFWNIPTFFRTLFGGGRDAFHVGEKEYAAATSIPVHGASFVGLFLTRSAVTKGGFPDGRLFIYGDDVMYTLGLTQAGVKMVFAPAVRFEHDCSTVTREAIFRPLWKTYYHHRNLWFVYRRAAGPLLFWPLIALMIPKWLIKGRGLEAGARRTYRRLIRMAIRDAVMHNLTRSHSEITLSAKVEGRTI